MARRRITESLLIIEAVVIIGFLYWFSLESRANAFLRTWMLQNFSLGLVLLDERMVLAVTGGILGTILVWLSTFQRGGQRRVRRVAGGLRAWLPGLGVQKMVMLVISGIGVMLLGLGGVRGSISLVLAGLGLIFWGAHLPNGYVWTGGSILARKRLPPPRTACDRGLGSLGGRSR